jgi:hypothetical protein
MKRAESQPLHLQYGILVLMTQMLSMKKVSSDTTASQVSSVAKGPTAPTSNSEALLSRSQESADKLSSFSKTCQTVQKGFF